MNTELFIENNKVDITEDVVVPLNFAVADIRDLSIRKTDFSKTIKVPGTKNNNKIFGHAYDINVVTRPEGASGNNIGVNYSQKKKADFILLADGASVLNGTAELKSIDVSDGRITYEVVLFGELGNLMSTLGDKKLSDLSMPELTHNYTKENIVASWSGSTDYMYPLIDYGVNRTRGEAFTVSALKPAVYAKYYWDKIFDEAGFDYESDFITGSLFTEIIIPYNRDGFVQSDVSSIDVDAFQSTIVTSSDSAPYPQIDSQVYDSESTSTTRFDEATKRYTASGSERINIASSLLVTQTYTFEYNTSDVASNDTITKAPVEHSMSMFVYDSTGSLKTIGTANPIVDEVSIPEETQQLITTGIGGSGKFITDVFVDNIAFNVNRANLSLEDGDYIEWYIDTNVGEVNTTGPQFNLEVTSSIQSGSTSLDITSAGIEGGELTQEDFVPVDITQKDFILNMAKLFNLYIYPDKNVPKKIHIEPRDDFYADFDSIDWTYKLDLDRPSKIETLESSKNRTLVYKYKDDPEDFFLKTYKAKHDKTYGEKRVDTGYNFNTVEKDVLNLDFGTAVSVDYSNESERGELNVEIHSGSLDTCYVTSFAEVTNLFTGSADFQDPDDDFPRFKRTFIGRKVEILGSEYTISDLPSPWSFKVSGSITIPSGSPASYDPTNIRVSNIPFFYTGNDTKVIPAIYKSDDGGITIEQFVSVPRVLRYSKIINLDDGETYTIQDTPIEIPVINVSAYQTYTTTEYVYNNPSNPSLELGTYPFVSHVNDPQVPTFDLLFDKPEETFWNITL